jgi:hypothetical protein
MHSRPSFYQHFRRRIPVFLLVVTLLALHGNKQAVAAAPIQFLEIGLWPQYDDPRTLVILRGSVAEAGLSVEIALPAETVLNAVAEPESDGSLQELATTSRSAQGVTLISFRPSGVEFQVEFYAMSTGPGPVREIALTLPPQPMDIKQLQWHIVIPPDGFDFSANPPLLASGQTTQGLPRFVGAFGPLPHSTAVTQYVRYKRLSDVPLVDQAMLSITETRPPDNRWLPGAALFSLAGGLVLLVRGVILSRERPTKARCSCGATLRSMAQYCSQCGRSAESARIS